MWGERREIVGNKKDVGQCFDSGCLARETAVELKDVEYIYNFFFFFFIYKTKKQTSSAFEFSFCARD